MIRKTETMSADTTSQETRRAVNRVVGIGALAGGLESLTELFNAIHHATGMAFVVISHLDPKHKSELSEILSRACALPVREVDDGMAVVPDHVYVMPSDRDMVITQGVFRLTAGAESGVPHKPVDFFLRSLAVECGNRAVGVILSGTGMDGTVGLKEIKEAGGLTFAERVGPVPRHASQRRRGGRGRCGPAPAQVAVELLHIATSSPVIAGRDAAPPKGSIEEITFIKILRLLSETTGVDFVHYKHSTLLRRVERRMFLAKSSTCPTTSSSCATTAPSGGCCLRKS